MEKNGSFRILRDEFDLSAATVAQKLADGGYNHIVDKTVKLYEQRTQTLETLVPAGILDTPILAYILDKTLTTLTLPSVAERLPAEVVDRGEIAKQLGEFLTTKMTKTERWNLYTTLYRHYYIGDKIEEYLFTGADHDKKLIKNVFQEATFAAGGALRLLKSEGVAEEHTNIIKNSSSLPQKINTCHGARMPEMYDKLGFPYVSIQHLVQYTNKKTGTLVGFSKKAADILKELRRVEPTNPKSRLAGGCPAGLIPSTGHKNQTVLIDYWEEMVDYLTMPGATTDSEPLTLKTID